MQHAHTPFHYINSATYVQCVIILVPYHSRFTGPLPGAAPHIRRHAPRPQPVTQKKLQIFADVFAPVIGTPKQGFVSADQTPFESSQEAAAKVISRW